jgi:ABC-type uncharacterized transport system ATPase subunit
MAIFGAVLLGLILFFPQGLLGWMKERGYCRGSKGIRWNPQYYESTMWAKSFGKTIQPKLLLLDEPPLGLSPKWVKTVFEKIIEIKKSGLPCLIVEQKAAMVLEYADYGYVVEMGNNRYEGKGQDLLNNPDVRRLYLGE